jgi:hypothetical protein
MLDECKPLYTGKGMIMDKGLGWAVKVDRSLTPG